MAYKGKRTLLVDLDPQANSTISFLDLQDINLSAYDFLTENDVQWSDLVRSSKVENLEVMPARISLAKVEGKLVGELDAPFRLKDRLDNVRRKYDVIIIDTPP